MITVAMISKTPGQRYYEATPLDTFARSTWDELTPEEKREWQDAAEDELRAARHTGQRPAWSTDEDFSRR